MRQLSFVENNRPGDSRLPANRRAVRSWAARDPMGKAGQRLKRRRRRYKPPSIVYIDERAIEALQSTKPAPLAQQQQQQEEEEPSSATSQAPPSSVFTPINYAPQHPQTFPNGNQSQTPPTLAALPSQTPRNDTLYLPQASPPQHPASAARSPLPAAKPLNPIFIDPGKNHPRVVRQPPPIAIPEYVRSDRSITNLEPAVPHANQWPDLTLKNRTHSLGAPLPSETKHLYGGTEPYYTHASASPPSAVSEPVHRLITDHRTGLPPIDPSNLLLCEADRKSSTNSGSPQPTSATRDSESPRTNSFTAFAIRHSNFAWSHNVHDGAAPLAIVRTPVPLSAPGAFERVVSPPRTYGMNPPPRSAPPGPMRYGQTCLDAVQQACPVSGREMQPATPLGSLSRLPAEIRAMIFSRLLVSQAAGHQTHGHGSGISTSILGTSHAIHSEAIDLLYNSPHHLTLHPIKSPSAHCQHAPPLQPLPPYSVISRMRNVTLAITFSTINRGDCERCIKDPETIVALSDPVALVLLRSRTLAFLTLLLLNDSQRKMGAKHFRLKEVTLQMKRILFPFAYIGREIGIEVAGFDTLDFAEMFEEMRNEFSGREAPIKELLDDALGSRAFGAADYGA